jgi:hypothetical protein
MGKAFALLNDESLRGDHRKRLLSFIDKYANGVVTNRLATDRGDGRNYSNAGGVQNLPGLLRSIICGHYSDIDCDTSHPSNLIDALRAFDLPVPDILYDFVTRKSEIRHIMAGFYFGEPITSEKKDKAKKLINALLYGQSTQSGTFFEECGITVHMHHDSIIEFAQAVNNCATKLIKKCDQDVEFAKEKNPSAGDHKHKFTALSELLVRIEEQKLSCIISRLVDHWGINPNTAISMHDGVMVSINSIHPDKALAKRGNPKIDREVLEDVCIYVRNKLESSYGSQ